MKQLIERIIQQSASQIPFSKMQEFEVFHHASLATEYFLPHELAYLAIRQHFRKEKNFEKADKEKNKLISFVDGMSNGNIAVEIIDKKNSVQISYSIPLHVLEKIEISFDFNGYLDLSDIKSKVLTNI